MKNINQIRMDIKDLILAILSLIYVFSGCGYLIIISLLFEGYFLIGISLFIINSGILFYDYISK